MLILVSFQGSRLNNGVQNKDDIDLMKAPFCAIRHNNTQFSNVLGNRFYNKNTDGLSVPLSRLKDNVQLETEEKSP